MGLWMSYKSIHVMNKYQFKKFNKIKSWKLLLWHGLIRKISYHFKLCMVFRIDLILYSVSMPLRQRNKSRVVFINNCLFSDKATTIVLLYIVPPLDHSLAICLGVIVCVQLFQGSSSSSSYYWLYLEGTSHKCY